MGAPTVLGGPDFVELDGRVLARLPESRAILFRDVASSCDLGLLGFLEKKKKKTIVRLKCEKLIVKVRIKLKISQ